MRRPLALTATVLAVVALAGCVPEPAADPTPTPSITEGAALPGSDALETWADRALPGNTIGGASILREVGQLQPGPRFSAATYEVQPSTGEWKVQIACAAHGTSPITLDISVDGVRSSQTAVACAEDVDATAEVTDIPLPSGAGATLDLVADTLTVYVVQVVRNDAA